MIGLCLVLVVSALYSNAQGEDPGRGSIRLYKNGDTSSGFSEGIVEIYYKSKWGTACIDFSTYDTALSVCRQLGYSTGSVTSSSQYGNGSPNPVISVVSCSSNELNLLKCDFTDAIEGTTTCINDKLAVQCSGSRTNYAGRVRLTGQTNTMGTSSGQIEAYCNGIWGAICNNSFTQDDANIVCRQLGFTSATDYQKSYSNQESLPIWFNSPDCDGSERCLSTCTDCPSSELSCSSTGIAGVTCSYEFSDSSTGGYYETCLLADDSRSLHVIAIIAGVVVAFIVCKALIIIIPIICCCCLGVRIGAGTSRRTKYSTI